MAPTKATNTATPTLMPIIALRSESPSFEDAAPLFALVGAAVVVATGAAVVDGGKGTVVEGPTWRAVRVAVTCVGGVGAGGETGRVAVRD